MTTEHLFITIIIIFNTGFLLGFLTCWAIARHFKKMDVNEMFK